MRPWSRADQAGGKAVGLTGQDGAFIRARKMLLADKDNARVDIGQVGEVESIDPAVIRALEGGGFIPVVAPIGTGADGTTYNINADLVAGKLAEILSAEKLVVLTNTPGVLDKDGKLLTGLTPRKIDQLMTRPFLEGVIEPSAVLWPRPCRARAERHSRLGPRSRFWVQRHRAARGRAGRKPSREDHATGTGRLDLPTEHGGRATYSFSKSGGTAEECRATNAR